MIKKALNEDDEEAANKLGVIDRLVSSIVILFWGIFRQNKTNFVSKPCLVREILGYQVE